MAPYRSVYLAHPLTEAAELGVAPAFVGVLAAVLVVTAAGIAARRHPDHVPDPTPLTALLESRLSQPLGPVQVAGRLVGGGLLVVAVAAGRVGSPEQLDNIAPALVIGLGWPVLLLLTAVVGGVWGWLQPFDALARPLERAAGGGASRQEQVGHGDPPACPSDVRGPGPAWLPVVAVVGAVGWTWWLALWQPGLQPRATGLGLGLYTVVVLAGCLAVGRARWLASAEVFTTAFGALARSRRGLVALGRWRAVALAVLVGGLAAAEVRFSRWYLADVESLGLLPFSEPAAVLGYLTLVALGIASVLGARRWAARTGAAATVDSVLPWLVAGFGLSAAVERDRLWTSAQVVLARASNPFGGDADVLGTADMAIVGWPYGDLGRLSVQLLLLVMPPLIGVALASRRHAGGRADAATALVASWVLLGALSAATL